MPGVWDGPTRAHGNLITARAAWRDGRRVGVLAQEALNTVRQVGDEGATATNLSVLGEIACADYEVKVKLLASAMDTATFAAALEEGRAMTLEQAIEYALSSLPPA